MTWLVREPDDWPLYAVAERPWWKCAALCQEVLWNISWVGLVGWGIGGFWIMDASHLAPVFEQFVWMPNQAHQGYIDVYNQLGVVGISLLLAGIGWYFFSLSRLQRKHVWHWVFIGLIILNLQESAFLRPRHFSNFLFIFCYLALFTDAVKESRLLKNETQHF